MVRGFYDGVFSNSHMDYDISLIDEKVDSANYDENYLKNLFDAKTLDMLKRVNFTNITTTCSAKTLQNSIKSGNITSAMLYLSDKFLMPPGPSDGMVSLDSATYIERVCKENNIKINTRVIEDGHHDLLSDSSVISFFVGNIIYGR